MIKPVPARRRIFTSLGLLAATLLLGGFAREASARQTTLRGFVTDQTTEQALQGATIALQADPGVLLGTATDGDGYFILNAVPPGTYRLRISFVGFTSYEESLTLTAGSVVRRHVALVPRDTEIDEVVVEAEREAGVTTVAAGLQSVVPAQIERVPMPGVSGDLASYIQTVPGVLVQGDRGGQFFVRGGAVDQNLALLDGLPVYMPFHIVSFYSAFPEAIINHADLYTGGFGARYRTRLSSVIDVRARNGNKQNLAGAVAIAPFMSEARVEGPLLKERVSVIGTVRQSLIEEVLPEIWGQRLPYRFGDQFGKIHAFLSAAHSLSVTGLHTFDRGDVAGTKKTFQGDAAATAINDSTSVGWENTVFGATYVFQPRTLPLRAEVIAGQSEMTNDFGPRNAPERTSKIHSRDVAAHMTLALERFDLHAGTTWRTSTLSYELDGQFETVSSAEQDLIEGTAYAEGAFTLLAGAMSIRPGLHLYLLPDRSQAWLEPRFRATWQPGGPGSRHQVNAAGGLYHQAVVGLNDERDVGNVFTAWLPTPEGAPIPEALHAILGWNFRVGPTLSFATEGFYKSFNNLSVPIFSAFPRFTTALQPADGYAAGIDLRMETRDQPFWFESVLDGYVSYALSTVEYKTAPFTYAPAHDRRHQVNALLHAGKGEVGITVQWQLGTGLPFTESGGFDVWYLLTPDVDVTSEAGQDRVIYGEPFRGRQPTYERLDVWIERRIETGRYVATLRAGAVNVFNRDNLFYYDLFTLKRIDQLPLIPSVGLKLELR